MRCAPKHHFRPLYDISGWIVGEAGARVKLRQTTLPADLADIQKRIKFIVHRGQLTDGLGNQVDFKNTIIIVTSDLGFSIPVTAGGPVEPPAGTLLYTF
jgi:ATP-dependent Clp protease ATP-binding subunit ClpA